MHIKLQNQVIKRYYTEEKSQQNWRTKKFQDRIIKKNELQQLSCMYTFMVSNESSTILILLTVRQ